jgi:RecG-like helicase
VLVRGTVRRLHVFPRRLLDVIVERGGASVRARWFRAARVDGEVVREGRSVALAGRCARPRRRRARWCTRATSPPSWPRAGGRGWGLRPRYADVEGVKRRTLAALATSALAALAPDTASCCPRRRARGWICRRWRSRSARCTPRARPRRRGEALAQARRRIALETLFVTQVAFLRRRAAAGAAALSVPAAAAAACARAWRRRSGSR